MSKNLRISLFGVIGAFSGFALQGCFASQPTPECSVTITSAGLGVAPYYVKLEKTSGTGACADLKFMRMGMMRYRTQASGGAFTVAVKPSLVVDPALGYSFSADTDPANNCVNAADCLGEADPSAMCLVSPTRTVDGTPVVDGGTATPTDGGDPFPVDPANQCMAVEEPVVRVDSMDTKRANLNGIGQMPQFPTKNVCTITDVVGAVQNFRAEMLDLADGGTLNLPAATYKTEFTDFNVLTSTKVPGTAFTSNIKFTAGSCVAEYKAVGFWPEVACTTDENCNPSANLDAGRVTGSGINPEFKPKCETALGVCVPTVDITTIK